MVLAINENNKLQNNIQTIIQQYKDSSDTGLFMPSQMKRYLYESVRFCMMTPGSSYPNCITYTYFMTVTDWL